MTELPMGWRHAKLEDVATVTMGQSPPGSSYNTDGIGKPFFQGKAEFGDTHPTVAKWTTSGTKFARPGDILMSVRAPVGPTNVADVDCVIGRGLAAITADPATVSQQYLIWVIKHLESEIASQGKGSTFDSISGVDLRGTLLPVPPLIEQKRIVDILEEQLSRLDAGTFGLIKTERLLSRQSAAVLAEEVSRTSVFPLVPLKALGKWVTGSTPPTADKKNSGKDVPFVTPGDVRYGEKILDTRRYISQAGADKVRQLPPNTVQLVSIGATLGKVGWTDQSVTTNQQIHSLIPDPSIAIAEYVALYLSAPQIQAQLWETSSSTTVPILNKSKLESIQVHFPPISKQELFLEEFVQTRSTLEQINAMVALSSTKASALRRALLDAAFTGRLTNESPMADLQESLTS